MRCARCGAESPPRFKFCGECGHPLTGPPATAPSTQRDEEIAPAVLVDSPSTLRGTPEAERRQLTVMFCDLVGSTPLAEKLDPEELRQVIIAYQEMCAHVIRRFEGYLARYIGDGLLVYFGYPQAHEDDAQRAVRAGLGIMAGLPQLNAQLQQTVKVLQQVPLQIRIGIHTGLVVVGDMGGGGFRDPMAIVGETPNIAARLQGIAEPDTVIISAATYRLMQGSFECRNLGPQKLKGVSSPIPAYRILSESRPQSRFDVRTASGLTPLVGREEELGLLLQRWEKVKEGKGQVVLLSGEAGIGKSRLLRELHEQLTSEPQTRLEFRCSPYYQDSALYPVIDLLQRVLEFRGEDSPQEKVRKLEGALVPSDLAQLEVVPLVAALLSLPVPEWYPQLVLTPQTQREKTQQALLAWLLKEAERRLLFMVWEDLQWADPSTLEFLSLLLDQAPQAGIFVLLSYRPEFTPPWGQRPHLTPLTLSRLPQLQAEMMIERVTGGQTLPAEVVQQIVSKTDGVPLFVEELTKTVLESGLVQLVNSHYELTGPLPLLAIPATLADALMARLDRLARAKEVAQLGATLGREFPYALLQAIAPVEEGSLQHALAKLVEADVLAQRGLPPRARYLFKHALIQDAAYNSLLLQRRKELHRAVGQAIEDLYAERLSEYQEELAYHYERGEVWEKALEYLVKAGKQLRQVYANQEALVHYNRALAICERLGAAVQPATLMMLYFGKWVLHYVRSELLPSIEAAQRLLEVARQHGDREQEAQALSRLSASFFNAHEFEKTLHYAEQAKGVASEIGAKNILAESIYAMGLVYEVTGNLREATRCYEESLRISREAGHKRFEGLSLSLLGLLTSWRGEYGQALQLHEQAISIGRTHKLQDPLLTFFWTKGVACCGKGEYELALASLQEGLELSERLGDKFLKCRLLNTLGWVYGELYDLERAIRYNKEGAEVSYALGDPESIRNAEINLGDDYLLLGDVEQAQRYLEKVYRDSQQRGKWGEEFLKWRYLQHCCHSLGELWLMKGDTEKALQLATECLKLAESTESRKNIVKGWRLQGQAFCLQGSLAAAEAKLQKALAVAKQIGNPPQLWKTYQALGTVYERQGVPDQARSTYTSALAVIEGVASQLQDQELKRIFLSARPVREIKERRQNG